MSMTEKLIAIFQIVVDWLKFAETKNGIFLAFLGTVIAVMVNCFSTITKVSISIKLGILISILLLCVSAIFCSLSFLPKTNIDRMILSIDKYFINHKKHNNIQDSDNFYYFGHLRKYKADELIDSIERLYFGAKPNEKHSKEDLDIANQIIINSQITSVKFRLFTISLWFFILAILVILIVGLLFLVYLRLQKLPI